VSNTLSCNLVILGSILSAVAAYGMTAALAPSVSSPVPVGTQVTFSATVPDAPSPNLWYRFRVRGQRGGYQVIRDYGPGNTLVWTASDHEGAYEIEVSARDLDTGDESTTSSLFEFQPVVTGADPVVSPTPNSLVFLFSAPACRGGSRMRVQFQSAPGIVQQAIACSRPGARILLFAQTSATERIEASGADICVGERSLFGCYSASVDLQQESARLVFGSELPLDELISHRLPLVKIRSGIDLALHPGPKSLKIIVQPQRWS